jgi:choline dehydrogenase-like flavoprotein
LDRFRPQDFTPRRYFSDISDTSLPEAWPVGYEEMEPFYARAENLYRVRGTQDPLATSVSSLLEPPPASSAELAIYDALTGVGLNPYRIHSALERLPGCVGCPGALCRRECRNDAARICLYPALDRYGAKILPNCRAVRFEARASLVERVICESSGGRIALRARVFILAANAFLTPALLQRSANGRFPNGLANSSGLVGHNLMLHASSHLFLRLKRARRTSDFKINHGLSLNDFYLYKGTKLGNFHAHPIVTHDELTAFLAQYYAGLNMLPGRLVSLISMMRTALSHSWTVFAAIAEDLPYHGNCVMAKAGSDDDIVYTYRYPDELRHRAQMMSEGLISAVAPLFDVHLLRPDGALNGSHVCGTCCFGNDPRTSVLDRDNRAHDLDNLYVLDGSFFPSSGGINPSLTIIANSLRVTDKVAQRL